MPMPSSALPRTRLQPDVLVLGGGIIGLSLALELHARGAQVIVLERDRAMSHASSAAAGMLAASDPHNPPELRTLSQFSLSLYPAFLRRIENASGSAVPFQTVRTVQHSSHDTQATLQEYSLDPRQLAPALLAAVRSTSIQLLEHTEVLSIRRGIAETHDRRFNAGHIITASGSWNLGEPLVFPRKGQMLRVRIPSGLSLSEVHRSEHVYVVPRTTGPQAGTALIGATVEEAGFDITTRSEDLDHLRWSAATLIPELGSKQFAPQIEAWAGLRPATADLLPILGRVGDNAEAKHFVATGHFRNGILLAPGTASVISDLIESGRSAVDIAAFSALRAGLVNAAQADR